MSRTSLSHPLRIDTVSAGAGCIGMTFSPGKKGPSVFGDSWDRDLEADLVVITAWRPTVVVTLIEAEEFNAARQRIAHYNRINILWFR